MGRPFLYGTTREFLIHFGLKDLSEMPQLQEFEELIGEKIKPDVFHTQADSNLEIEEEPVSAENMDVEIPSVEDDEFFDAPFEEKDSSETRSDD